MWKEVKEFKRSFVSEDCRLDNNAEISIDYKYIKELKPFSVQVFEIFDSKCGSRFRDSFAVESTAFGTLASRWWDITVTFGGHKFTGRVVLSYCNFMLQIENF